MAKVQLICEPELFKSLSWLMQNDGHTVVDSEPEIGIASQNAPLNWPSELPLIVLITTITSDWQYMRQDGIIYMPMPFKPDFLLRIIQESTRR